MNIQPFFLNLPKTVQKFMFERAFEQKNVRKIENWMNHGLSLEKIQNFNPTKPYLYWAKATQDEKWDAALLLTPPFYLENEEHKRLLNYWALKMENYKSYYSRSYSQQEAINGLNLILEKWTKNVELSALQSILVGMRKQNTFFDVDAPTPEPLKDFMIKIDPNYWEMFEAGILNKGIPESNRHTHMKKNRI